MLPERAPAAGEDAGADGLDGGDAEKDCQEEVIGERADEVSRVMQSCSRLHSH